jgi:HEAT repeat protein
MERRAGRNVSWREAATSHWLGRACGFVFSWLLFGWPLVVEAQQEEPTEEVESTAPEPPMLRERFGRGHLLAQVRSGSVEQRVAAIEELARRRDRRSLPTLLAVLQEEGASTSQTEVVAAIVQALGQLDDRRAVPSLLGLLNGRNPHQRAALVALAALGDERALEPVVALLTRPSLSAAAAETLAALGPGVGVRLAASLRDPTAAGAACHGLGRLGDWRTTWLMIRALNSPRPDVRRHCASALGELGDPRAQRALVGLLRDPDVRVQEAALRALRRVADGALGRVLLPWLLDEGQVALALPLLEGSSVEEVTPVLASLAVGDEGESRQFEAIDALGRIGGESAGSILAGVLRSRHGPARYRAALALASLGPAHGLGPLLRSARTAGPGRVEGFRGLATLFHPTWGEAPAMAADVAELARRTLLEEDSPAVVAAAALVVVAGEGPAAIDALARRLDRPASTLLRARLVALLGPLPSPRSCDLLARALVDPEVAVRAAAARASGEGGCATLGPLLHTVAGRGDGAQANAVWALGVLGQAQARALLRRLLTTGPVPVRANSALALAALGIDRAGPDLRRQLRREVDPTAQQALLRALTSGGGSQNRRLLEQWQDKPGMVGLAARDGLSLLRRGGSWRPLAGHSLFQARLVDAHGAPAAGLPFTLSLPGGTMLTGLTDPNGEIWVASVPEGPCRLVVGSGI